MALPLAPRRLAAALLLPLVFLAGCGESTSSSVGGVSPSLDMASSAGRNAAPSYAPVEEGEGLVAPQQKQIIKRGSLALEVKEVQEVLDASVAVIRKHGGEITLQTSSVEGKQLTVGNGSTRPGDYYPNPVVGDYAYLTLTVPADKFEPLLEELKEQGKVITESVTADDVTLTILGLQAQMDSAVKSITTLEDLLVKATTVDDILKIEGALQQRKQSLASMQAQETSLKQQVARSSLTLQLVTPVAHVKAEQEMNWWEKFVDRLDKGTVDALALAVVAIIFFLPLALFFLLLRWTLKQVDGRRASKTPPPAFTPAPQEHPHPREEASSQQEASPEAPSLEVTPENEGREGPEDSA